MVVKRYVVVGGQKMSFVHFVFLARINILANNKKKWLTFILLVDIGSIKELSEESRRKALKGLPKNMLFRSFYFLLFPF